MLINCKTSKVVIKHSVIVLFLSTLVACAGANSDDGGPVSRASDCIYQPSIRGYSVLDESNLIVSAARRHKYHLVLDGRIHGLRHVNGIGFKSGTGRICSGFDQVVVAGNFGRESRRITSIRQLSPEEEEGLLIRYGRKKPEIEHTPAPRDVKGAEVEELDAGADDE